MTVGMEEVSHVPNWTITEQMHILSINMKLKTNIHKRQLAAWKNTRTLIEIIFKVFYSSLQPNHT